MAGIRRNETATKCRRQLLIGKIATDLMTIYDNAPESREEVSRLLGNICELIHLYSTPDNKLAEVPEEVIREKLMQL